MTKLYRMIEDPQEGDTVQFLGVYALRWPRDCGVEPTVAFIEAETNETLCATLAAALENLIEQDIRQDEVEAARRMRGARPQHFPDWPEAWGIAHSALSDYYEEYPDATVSTLQ